MVDSGARPAMRSRRWPVFRCGATRSLAAAVLLVVVGSAPAFGQYLGTRWGGGWNHRTYLSDDSRGIRLASVDVARTYIELYQGVGSFQATYRLTVAAAYSAQEQTLFGDLSRDFVPYAGPTSAHFLSAPAHADDRWLEFEIGRLQLTDPFGLLFHNPDTTEQHQLADGLAFGYRNPRFYVSASAAYVGLIHSSINRIRMNASDAASVVEDNDLFAFAPRRAIVTGRLERSAWLSRQDTGLVVVAQQDFENADDAISSYYLGLYAQGDVGLRLRHQTAVVGSFSVAELTDQEGVGLLASVIAEYSVPFAAIDVAWSRAQFASGDAAGLAPFPALAGPDIADRFAERLTDVGVVEVGMRNTYASVPPGSFLTPSFAVRALFVPSGQTTPVTAIEPTGSYAGAELAPSVEYQITSGASIDLSAGILFAEGGVATVVRLGGKVEL